MDHVHDWQWVEEYEGTEWRRINGWVDVNDVPHDSTEGLPEAIERDTVHHIVLSCYARGDEQTKTLRQFIECRDCFEQIDYSGELTFE